MKFQTFRLGNVVTLKRGFDLPESKRIEGDIPIISSSGIFSYHNEKKLDGPGVVTGRYGTLGEVFYVEGPYWPLNTALYVQDFHGNDPRFISYFLRDHLKGIKSDKAAVPGVNRNDLHENQVRIPDVATQLRIASILSAYDDLIANNRRRIQLLERAARELYKEWFVRLRFPGHAHTRIVDGVPEGWERRKLGEIATLNYGKSLKEEERVPGDYPVFGSSGIVGTHEKPLVQGPGIVVGRKGNAGSVFWADTDFFPIDTTYFINSQSSTLHLYYALLHTNFISTDVAVPGLNRDLAHSRIILMPLNETLNQFEETISPMFRQIATLRKYCESLKGARDLLLPRLMRGELFSPQPKP